MQQTFSFKINGQDFWIDQFDDGYCWFTDGVEGRSYETIAAAQQGAMDWVKNIEPEVYDIGQYHDDRRE